MTQAERFNNTIKIMKEQGVRAVSFYPGVVHHATTESVCQEMNEVLGKLISGDCEKLTEEELVKL